VVVAHRGVELELLDDESTHHDFSPLKQAWPRGWLNLSSAYWRIKRSLVSPQNSLFSVVVQKTSLAAIDHEDSSIRFPSKRNGSALF
jgi:hypothetical protein